MARIYDYFLGGKNHFPADRETADKILAANPAIRVTARENRAFLGRCGQVSGGRGRHPAVP